MNKKITVLNDNPTINKKLDVLSRGAIYDLMVAAKKAGEYLEFWYISAYCVKTKNYSEGMSQLITKTASWREVKPTHYNNFIVGFGHFINSTNFFSGQDLFDLLKMDKKYFLLKVIDANSAGTLDVFKDYVKSVKLESVSSNRVLRNWVENKEFVKIFALLDLTIDNTYDDSEFLKELIDDGVLNFDIFKRFVKLGFDINAYDHGLRSKNVTHYIFTDTSQKADLFFKQYIEEFGREINFDCDYKYYSYEHKVDISNSPIVLIANHKEMKAVEKLNRLELIIKNCNLTDKNISEIASYILSSSVIAKNYDHSIYNTLFKNEIFNSDKFSRHNILLLILEADNKKEVVELRNQANNTINPTLVLLKDFFEHTSVYDRKKTVPEFFYWAKLQNNKFSNSTAEYLLEKYRNEVTSFTQFQFDIMPNSLNAFLKKEGINVPNKTNFFNRIFSKFMPEKAIETKVNVEPQVREEVKKDIKEFNHVLYSQIKDKDVEKFVSSIILNREQYDILCSQEFYTGNHFYMTGSLPNLLNKTIENYLHFATMDEEEAKENVLSQLKLLNRKTFEVLNISLEDEKNNVKKQGRANTKVINMKV